MSINEVQDEVIAEFNDFDDWMDRYQLLIDLGNEQEPLDDKYKTEQNLIEGCQSRVWLQADEENGRRFRRLLDRAFGHTVWSRENRRGGRPVWHCGVFDDRRLGMAGRPRLSEYHRRDFHIALPLGIRQPPYPRIQKIDVAGANHQARRAACHHASPYGLRPGDES